MFGDPIGALLPFAQHKGFALAVMCEFLGGALSGGQRAGPRPRPEPDDQQHAVGRLRARQAVRATELAQQVAEPRGMVARIAARAPGRAGSACRANRSGIDRARARARGIPLPAPHGTRAALRARGAARCGSCRGIRLTHAMPRRHVTRFTVEFGDCDPAQIVFYPNFLRWMDAASLHYFRACGRAAVARARAAGRASSARRSSTCRRASCAPASYGDAIDVETSIAEWRGKSFVLAHVIRRGDDGAGRRARGAHLRAPASRRSGAHPGGRAARTSAAAWSNDGRAVQANAPDAARDATIRARRTRRLSEGSDARRTETRRASARAGARPGGRVLLAACKWTAIAGGLVFVAMVAMEIVSIVGRKLFSWTVPGDVEMLQMGAAFASATFFAYCHMVQRRREGRLLHPQSRAAQGRAGSMRWARSWSACSAR